MKRVRRNRGHDSALDVDGVVEERTSHPAVHRFLCTALERRNGQQSDISGRPRRSSPSHSTLRGMKGERELGFFVKSAERGRL